MNKFVSKSWFVDHLCENYLESTIFETFFDLNDVNKIEVFLQTDNIQYIIWFTDGTSDDGMENLSIGEFLKLRDSLIE